MTQTIPCCEDVNCKRCRGLGEFKLLPKGECIGYGWNAHQKWHYGLPMTAGSRFMKWIRGKGQ